MSEPVPTRGCPATAYDPRSGGARWRRRAGMAAWLLVLLLQGCHHAAPASSAHATPRATAIFNRMPDGSQPLSPQRTIAVSTERPLSLWLRVAEGVPPAGRSHERVELGVLDGEGVPTTDALVRPVHFLSDADGYSPPLTFFAAEPGTYRIRVSFAGTDVYGPCIVVHSDGEAVRGVRRCSHL